MALPTKPSNVLSDAEKLFALEYLKDFNATRAYRDAHGGKVKAATAKTQGNRWINRPLVKAHLAQLTQKKLADVSAEVDDIIAQVARIAFFNPADFMTINPESGQPALYLDKAMNNPDLMQCLKVEFSINVTKDGDKVPVYKITPHDKMDALEKLFKLKKLYTGEQEESKRVINIYANFPTPGSQRPERLEDNSNVIDHDATAD